MLAIEKNCKGTVSFICRTQKKIFWGPVLFASQCSSKNLKQSVNENDHFWVDNHFIQKCSALQIILMRNADFEHILLTFSVSWTFFLSLAAFVIIDMQCDCGKCWAIDSRNLITGVSNNQSRECVCVCVQYVRYTSLIKCPHRTLLFSSSLPQRPLGNRSRKPGLPQQQEM